MGSRRDVGGRVWASLSSLANRERSLSTPGPAGSTALTPLSCLSLVPPFLSSCGERIAGRRCSRWGWVSFGLSTLGALVASGRAS